MNETYIKIGRGGFDVWRSGDNVVFRYKRFSEAERRFVYGKVIAVHIDLLRKILDDPALIEGVMR